jgi:hypothetical protein
MACKEISLGFHRVEINFPMFRVPTRDLIYICCALLVSAAWGSSVAGTPGLCREEKVSDRGGPILIRHLSKECTDAERLARSIPAVQVLDALATGKRIDLAGVSILGDLNLEKLPKQSLDQIGHRLSADDREIVTQLGISAIRLVTGGLSIRDAVVHGRITNRASTEPLVIAGPVILAGTTFEEPVDISKTVFLGIVDCSAATFAKESFFVQARFLQPAMFTQTTFGPHTRFHRSVFRGAASFHQVHFNGLAEFLEISFQAGADFTEAQFASGTGFSGSRFEGLADFLGSRFAGDVYFLFTQFDRGARFQGARFENIADFSDAAFPQGQDLQQAAFSKPARLPMSADSPATGSPVSLWITRYGITGFLVLLSLLLVVYLIKLK